MKRLPTWLKKNIPKQNNIRRLRKLIDENSISTVCESAKCPNIGECFSKNTLTFLILGNICTRNCRFCEVEKGIPLPVDADEPRKIAKAVEKLKLDYVVITSVTRDDLPDGGAGQFKKTIEYLRLNAAVSDPRGLLAGSDIKIEVLIPDFLGDKEALKTVISAGPLVINHNLETVPRLYLKVRPQADYKRSLKVLRYIKELDPSIYTKSGIMVGLGERDDEVAQVLRDLRSVGCDMVTIGQYLPPSRVHLPVERYVEPEVFESYNCLGLNVFAGPLVRSSYRASEAIRNKK